MQAQWGQKQGCQIFLWAWWKNVPNEYKMYKMVINYPKCS
jgi:hypothetical protein